MRSQVACSTLLAFALITGFATAGFAEGFECVVPDDEGDSNVSPGHGFDGAPYQDILETAIERTPDGHLVFSMEVAAAIPAAPQLRTPHGLLLWMWGMNTGPGVPQGFPLSPGVAGLLDFWIHVAWDGTDFQAVVIDRRPALQGGTPVTTSVPFSINGAIVTVIAESSLFDDPQNFTWGSSTWIWPTHLGTTGPHRVDQAPDVGGSACPAI